MRVLQNNMQLIDYKCCFQVNFLCKNEGYVTYKSKCMVQNE